MCNLETHLS